MESCLLGVMECLDGWVMVIWSLFTSQGGEAFIYKGEAVDCCHSVAAHSTHQIHPHHMYHIYNKYHIHQIHHLSQAWYSSHPFAHDMMMMTHDTYDDLGSRPWKACQCRWYHVGGGIQQQLSSLCKLNLESLWSKSMMAVSMMSNGCYASRLQHCNTSDKIFDIIHKSP